MTLFRRTRALIGLLVVALSLTVVAVDHADARRGGSFGSRGVRTFQMPRTTPTAPRQVQPVERTMTPRPTQTETGAVRTTGLQRPGAFGGFGGSLMRGLFLGGLLGLLLGHGFGGAAGLLGFIVQIAILGFGAVLLMRLMRGRQEPAYASGPAGAGSDFPVRDVRPAGGGLFGGATAAAAANGPADEIGVTQGDLDAFERLLSEIQDAYAREDYGALRERTTPEVAAYFSEELGRNASEGLRNEVSGVRLLQGDLSEAWREGAADYATVAMRYESVDVTRERATGRVVDGDPDRPTEATEIWTFTRRPGERWRLSAIQT